MNGLCESALRFMMYTRDYCIWPSMDGATAISVWDIWFVQSAHELYIDDPLPCVPVIASPPPKKIPTNMVLSDKFPRLAV